MLIAIWIQLVLPLVENFPVSSPKLMPLRHVFTVSNAVAHRRGITFDVIKTIAPTFNPIKAEPGVRSTVTKPRNARSRISIKFFFATENYLSPVACNF
jgi:hypothetical protein